MMKKLPAKPKMQELYIKNMVCDRCIRVVREELHLLGHDVRSIELGEVTVGKELTHAEIGSIKSMLSANGFELIENKNAKTIEAIKNAVIKLVHHHHDLQPLKQKYSEVIADSLGKEYHSLSVLFSSVENVTIEQYIIKQRIERVKELLKYDERSLSEISYMMGYSSVQHLSKQFKSVTGFTTGQFKKLTPHHHLHQRISLDKVK